MSARNRPEAKAQRRLVKVLNRAGRSWSPGVTITICHVCSRYTQAYDLAQPRMCLKCIRRAALALVRFR